MKLSYYYYLFFISFIFSACDHDNHHDHEKKVKRYDQARLERISEFQQKLIAKNITGSNIAMVFKDGEIIYKEVINSKKDGAEPITDRSIFPVWSMSKPITTVGAMILYEEGKFLLEDPVSKYIPEMASLSYRDENGFIKPCMETLTMRHILAHRSGWSYEFKYLNGIDAIIADTAFADLTDFAATIAQVPLDHEPGAQYTYGINTALVGRTIEVISGMTFYDFLKERLFDPLDMPNTKFYLTDEERKHFQPVLRTTESDTTFFKSEYNELSYSPDTRVQLGGEGLVSTPEDYSHFAEMLVNDGVYKGMRILSPAAIELMHSCQSPEGEDGFWNGFSYFHLNSPEKDGFLSTEGIFGWSGYHNTHFWIDQEKNLYGLFMTRRTPYSQDIQRQFRRAVYQAIL